MNIGHKIRELRKQRGITQEQLADGQKQADFRRRLKNIRKMIFC